MATLSETMTLAGFSARVTAGTLNIGQIYTISDKGWVLQAHSNTVAKPLHGALRIANGDNIPEGIVADEIIIDTGLTVDDTPIIISYPDYFFVNGLAVDAIGHDDTIQIGVNDGLTILSSFLLTSSPSVRRSEQIKSDNTTLNVSVDLILGNDNFPMFAGFRAFITMSKLK